MSTSRLCGCRRSRCARCPSLCARTYTRQVRRTCRSDRRSGTRSHTRSRSRRRPNRSSRLSHCRIGTITITLKSTEHRGRSTEPCDQSTRRRICQQRQRICHNRNAAELRRGNSPCKGFRQSYWRIDRGGWSGCFANEACCSAVHLGGTCDIVGIG